MSKYIFGAGYIGNRLFNSKEFKEYKLIGRELHFLDFDKLEEWFILNKPQIIINCIGKTGSKEVPNVDWCEDHRQETIESNVIVPYYLAILCKKYSCHLVHFSSGCIFEGENKYAEFNVPNFSKSFYSWSKIEGERMIKSVFDNYLIVRIRMPIDNISSPRNLIDKLLKYPEVIDTQNSMTTIPHMIPILADLIHYNINGIYNFTNPGTISAFEILKLYNEIVGPHNFEYMPLNKLQHIVKAPRSNCTLSSELLDNCCIIFNLQRMPEIHQAVRECLRTYKTKTL